MQINFEYDNVAASSRLEELTRKRVNKLVDKYDFIVRADVFFKTENTSSKNTGKICKIRVSVPGPRLFAEASHEKFEMSIAEATEDLDKQLKKRKEKMKARK
ncbi:MULTISPECIES: ribosome hibernation-promoting factor, HPF/YfiA family [Galbibacter]|uniref:Ribosome-associated translation inhibitor RaiA n=1 Tax=Galbibacter pacificus TaxID=2996052 RepID=A0ABT6FQG5_9FLAO|nr:ribosome-associated translation inhibitor RaiA [Galbibacter pacificus]MDG3582017.1 ribosome-associated translation inhibitor RaiA [Galbibacter pacificus]MDG3585509.1 ribosome-associated translation inhibitor RaiA [Galbibacter pacificus]